MKTIYYLVLFLLAGSFAANAQTVSIIKLKTDTTKSGSDTAAINANRFIKTIDSLIEKINTNTATISLDSFNNRLRDTSIYTRLAGSNKLKSVVDAVTTIKTNGGKKPTDSIPKVDSIPEAKEITSKCESLAKVESLKTEKQPDGSYSFAFVDKEENPLTSFKLKQYNEASFFNLMERSLKSLCTDKEDTNNVIALKDLIDKFKKEDLYQHLLEASLEVDDSRDEAGEMSIYKNIKVYKFKRRKGKKIFSEAGDFTAHSIQVHFQDGFIENIIVVGKMKGDNHFLKFENQLPIPFSTRREYRRLFDYKLIETTFRNKENCHIILGHILSYKQMLALDNKDYSPENTIYKNDQITDSITRVVLYKEQTSKILEAKIFTDLKGIDNTNPNGLIQFEVCKKLNFYTRRYPVLKLFNFGLFNYVTPQFSMNKIENNQKNLVLNIIDTSASTTDSKKPIAHASTLNLLRHQQFSVGMDVSMAIVDVPGWKSTFNFGTGLYFGRTALQDTLRHQSPGSTKFIADSANNVVEFGVNTFQWGPFVTWQIFPNPKYGMCVTQRFSNFKSLTTDFKQVRDSAHYVNFIQAQNGDRTKYDDYKYGNNLWNHCIGSTEIFAFFKPADNNKIFFRYRLSWDVQDTRQNFHQLQLGFATLLTSTKSSGKKGSQTVATE